MAQESPDEKFEIPDSCSSIKIVIECVHKPDLNAAILRNSLKYLFNAETKVEIHQADGENYENLNIEIKKDPGIPLTDNEKKYLRNNNGKLGIKISFD